MERFHGDQLDELFRFMNENDLEPMSDAEISTVCTRYWHY